MAYFGSVTITNKFGWTKTIEFKKALLTIGRNPSNDIVLSEEQGGGVAPLQMQLVCPKTGQQAYRVINLSEPMLEVVGGPSAGALIRPRTPQVLYHGDVLVIGEFTLAFELLTERGICIERRSANLGMKLELPHNQLRPEKRLAGLLTVTNYGANRRCQFTIELSGLPVECYRVSPAPLLYPGASESLEIQFFHRCNRPPAGQQTVIICASASQAYPQEMIQMSLDVMVEAVNKYSLAFDAPSEAHAAVKPQPAALEGPVFAPPSSERPAQAGLPAEDAPVHANVQLAHASAEAARAAADIPERQQMINRAEPARSASAAAAEEAAVPGVAASAVPVGDRAPAPVPDGTEPLLQGKPERPTPLPDAETDEQDWWTNQAAARAPQRQTESVFGTRRDLRTILAGKDIQVIKAGEEEMGAEPEQTENRENGSAE